MQLSVKGKQLDVGEALRSHVESALENTTGKYFPRPIDSLVVFSREGAAFRADITVHAGRGITVQAHAGSDNAYTAFDGALDRIAKRLRRYKRRLQDHHQRESQQMRAMAQQYILAPDSESEPEDGASNADNPVIIAEMPTAIEEMTVGEAVMRMDLADLPALLFQNSAHGGMNMIYRRNDGNIGWIDPAAQPAKAAANDDRR